ncbi:hypothetical protein GUJ93_ZPchr0003g18040 [Zizania palustris]|uniref:Uncharacterized protein n=1 Tax=Zizania palustris TaxID=103762 RepID=A0A8J5SST0_ZIZPA|nr:hypothetical protein GUJ93_ZPchr0003g18040 [Zizania palustris]
MRGSTLPLSPWPVTPRRRRLSVLVESDSCEGVRLGDREYRSSCTTKSGVADHGVEAWSRGRRTAGWRHARRMLVEWQPSRSPVTPRRRLLSLQPRAGRNGGPVVGARRSEERTEEKGRAVADGEWRRPGGGLVEEAQHRQRTGGVSSGRADGGDAECPADGWTVEDQI